MATKREVVEQLARGEGCLGWAALDEPVFVLRAKDPAAVLAIQIWCNIARNLDAHEPEKIADAEVEAMKMQHWRDQKKLETLHTNRGDDD